jgi:hypothetical protein
MAAKRANRKNAALQAERKATNHEGKNAVGL